MVLLAMALHRKALGLPLIIVLADLVRAFPRVGLTVRLAGTVPNVAKRDVREFLGAGARFQGLGFEPLGLGGFLLEFRGKYAKA